MGDRPRVVADRRRWETTIRLQFVGVFDREAHIVQGCFIALRQRFVGRTHEGIRPLKASDLEPDCIRADTMFSCHVITSIQVV
ncbi:conserved hypothetical protein [Xanthomonas citri pv. citri]|nr:conserved hypothetical protein [Xanthomonas citri pv. citri]CEJ23909.1 conserved hypothetical protein [Xanthomonas citri pv. citri]CEJ29887.1 conserved hypothetical protein [Xanthomonas citri pv. citri]